MNEFQNVSVPMASGPVGVSKYCNSSMVVFSPWEFSFELSQLTPYLQGVDETKQPPQPQIQVAKVVHDWVSMSPQHAKAFLKALSENVANYESQFGEIPEVQVQAASKNQQGGQS